MKKSTYIIAAILVAIILISLVLADFYVSSQSETQSSGKLQIVAGENFWGSLVSQLGGSHVQVLSIVTDPNTDPHEYESSTQNVQAVANAKYIIANGAGYDDWLLKLVSASNSPNQKVLNVADLLGQTVGSNPHFWYSPSYVNETVHQMYLDIVSLDPTNSAYYSQQYANLNASLGTYNQQIAQIKQQYSGTQVAATEDIFVYLADATGLDLVSPPAFMQAVAEGTDPPVQTVVQFQQQLESGTVKVLVYNSQTVTPITENMKTIANQNNVAIIGISETVEPPNALFQDWMNTELIALQNALNSTSTIK